MAMTVGQVRNFLNKEGLEVAKNKASGKYSLVMDNNVIDTSEKDRRQVVFMPLSSDSDHRYCMERDKFYTEFEVKDDDQAIGSLIGYLKSNLKKEKKKRNEAGQN